MGKNTKIYKDKITDFTDWGYGVVSQLKFKNSISYNNFYRYYIDRNFMGAILYKGLCGWGDTAIDAYLKAIKIEKTNNNINNFQKSKKTKKQYLNFSIESFTFYRISPRAKEYLDTYGFYDDNMGFTDLYLVKVPLTVDNNGYPVTYIIDLVDDETKEKMDIPVLNIINYQKGDSKKYFGKHGTLIKHDIKPIRHKIPKINNTNILYSCVANSEFYNGNKIDWVDILEDKNWIDKVYGLGNNPEQAFLDAIENFNNFFIYCKDNCMSVKHANWMQKNFELFFQIIPISNKAKKYIESFGTKRCSSTNKKHSIYDYEIDYYTFGEKSIKIPPVILSNGYPTEVVIDIIGNKELSIIETLEKIIN